MNNRIAPEKPIKVAGVKNPTGQERVRTRPTWWVWVGLGVVRKLKRTGEEGHLSRVYLTTTAAGKPEAEREEAA